MRGESGQGISFLWLVHFLFTTQLSLQSTLDDGGAFTAPVNELNCTRARLFLLKSKATKKEKKQKKKEKEKRNSAGLNLDQLLPTC